MVDYIEKMVRRIQENYGANIIVVASNDGSGEHTIYIDGHLATDGEQECDVCAYLRGYVYGLVRKAKFGGASKSREG